MYIFSKKIYNIDKFMLRRSGYMDIISLILVIVGAINWGLIGFFQFDLVAFLFGGQGALISRIVYALVGLAGLWCITFLFRDSKMLDK